MHTPELPALGFGDAEASVRSLWMNFKLWLHGVFEARHEALPEEMEERKKKDLLPALFS